jgi:uncharacterized protein YndB with AHSA1/START domain
MSTSKRQPARPQPAEHATFTIERTFEATPAAVFAAWSSAAAKARWFAGHDSWRQDVRELDFRVGGGERVRGTWSDGHVSDFIAHYHDIVPARRIVYSYAMHVDAKRISVSLSTVEFEPAAGGTRMRYTEQAAFLDGYDDAGAREHGTRALFDNLAAALSAG